jgi:hypothetical protein
MSEVLMADRNHRRQTAPFENHPACKFFRPGAMYGKLFNLISEHTRLTSWQCFTLQNKVYHGVGFGHAVAQLVEALRYKPEGGWFDSRWCH